MSKEGKAIRADGDGLASDKTKRQKVATKSDTGPKFCNADECITLHLVRTANDLEEDGDSLFSFPPEFSERFFGEDGRIYGYKGLKIDVWLHAVSFHAHVTIHYDAKLREGGPKYPTVDLQAKLKEIFGETLVDSRDVFLENIPSYTGSFLQVLQEEGKFLSSWRSGSEEKTSTGEATPPNQPGGKLRQVVQLELSDARVRKWYGYLTPLILLFIEAGRPIEIDDPLWEIYVTIEGEGPEMIITGFCSVYRFYHYPDSTRLRVSQILVLPPYQGQGNGFRLLDTINKVAVERDCYDVTMEDPSESLQELRDCMDVLRLLSFPPALSAVDSALTRIRGLGNHEGETASASVQFHDSSTVSRSTNGKNKSSHQSEPDATLGVKEKNILLPPTELVEEARKTLKITKMQLKRCWESLLFLQLESSEVAVQDIFRELLVRRLHSEIFSKSEEDVGHGKQVVDVANEYNSDKTFVMMRANQRGGSQANGSAATPKDMVDASEEEKKLQALQDLLEEREVELQAVADKVSLQCKSLGIFVNPRKYLSLSI